MGRSAPPLPEGEEKVHAVGAMFDAIAPRYDLVNRVMTFRMDVRWRRRTLDSLQLGGGARVLDIAAGTGDLCREMEHRGMAPIALDLSAGMLANARTAAPLVQSDARFLPIATAAMDGVTCGLALRNLVDLDACFAEMARVLRPGGSLALLEVSTPTNPVLAFGHRVYFGRVVPMIGGLFSDPAAYRYLPRSVAYLPPTPELLAMIERAGFTSVERQQLSTGIAQLITARRA
ncbi:MAG TPA: ubiquinone/menaquinone biosynthesis methyltransferase [Acidimicrobiales bacterium]|nr:ubiquinone/menaquinone biosynthesis methyltransferase [Acidimicrobiales bacterium]